MAEQEREPTRALSEEESRWGPQTTVNEAVEGWRENGWQDLSPNTVRGYDGVWRRHIRDSIGRRRIVSLSPYDVERFFRELKDKGAGPTTVRLSRALLHRSCRLARKWSGNQLPNPITDTELPTWAPDERPRAVRAPSSSEVVAILEMARFTEQRVAVLIRLVAATGMRRGEACALRWSDIDNDAGTVVIDEGVIGTPGGGAVARAPKTQASRRTVAVGPATLTQLASLHEEQDKLAQRCDVPLPEGSFVFSFEPGGSAPPHPDTMSHAFAEVRDAAGVACDVHLHSLRHFQSTELDRVISEAQKQARLGWATVHMARHYTGAVAAEDRRAAEHIEGVLFGEAASPATTSPRSRRRSGARQPDAAPATARPA